MFCPHCGSQNSNSATICTACGMPFEQQNPYQSSMAGPGPIHPGVDIPSYLVPAILTTICCCMPFGIVAIVYAAQVSGKLSGGDYEGARQSSNSAKMWCWIAFGVGLVSNILIWSAQMSFVGFNRGVHFGR
jgi:hypothetical protein